jgi:hypothetical protein
MAHRYAFGDTDNILLRKILANQESISVPAADLDRNVLKRILAAQGASGVPQGGGSNEYLKLILNNQADAIEALPT